MKERYEPFVSVIMCNYNYERFIGEAIESVLSQTYTNIELIIVDDGSTDNSREIISKYQDPRIITVFQENQGQAGALNSGFEKTRGEIIAFIDSDDCWKENKIEVIINKYRIFNVCAVQHQQYIISSYSKILKDIHPELKPGKYNILDLFIRNNDVGFFSSTSGITARKECLRKIFPIDTEWKICADIAFSYPLAFFGDIYTTEEILGYYRIHNSNNWMNSSEQKKIMQNKLKYIEYINIWFKKMNYSCSIDYTQSKQYREWMISQQSIFYPPKILFLIKNLVRLLRKKKNKSTIYY